MVLLPTNLLLGEPINILVYVRSFSNVFTKILLSMCGCHFPHIPSYIIHIRLSMVLLTGVDYINTSIVLKSYVWLGRAFHTIESEIYIPLLLYRKEAYYIDISTTLPLTLQS